MCCPIPLMLSREWRDFGRLSAISASVLLSAMMCAPLPSEEAMEARRSHRAAYSGSSLGRTPRSLAVGARCRFVAHGCAEEVDADAAAAEEAAATGTLEVAVDVDGSAASTSSQDEVAFGGVEGRTVRFELLTGIDHAGKSPVVRWMTADASRAAALAIWSCSV